MIPHDRPVAAECTPHAAPKAWANLQTVLTSIPALAGISIALWSSTANEMVNLVFGVWLADSFGLQIAALAGASAVIGVSELSGESLVALVTDRTRKGARRHAWADSQHGRVLLLPLIGRTEVGALVGLFLFYISFEFMLVSQLPMMTETVAHARGTVMAVNLVGFGLGRSLGALAVDLRLCEIGLPGGYTGVQAPSMCLALLALAEMQQKIMLVPRLLAWFRELTHGE